LNNCVGLLVFPKGTSGKQLNQWQSLLRTILLCIWEGIFGLVCSWLDSFLAFTCVFSVRFLARFLACLLAWFPKGPFAKQAENNQVGVLDWVSPRKFANQASKTRLSKQTQGKPFLISNTHAFEGASL